MQSYLTWESEDGHHISAAVKFSILPITGYSGQITQDLRKVTTQTGYIQGVYVHRYAPGWLSINVGPVGISLSGLGFSEYNLEFNL